MEQHPIPRQITTFEFKLIGFMTLKQFLYLVIFIPLGLIVWKIFPIPIINIFLGFLVAGIGVAVAFFPFNDRPLDVWLKNLLRRMVSPTQYMYHKHNVALPFLSNLYFINDPHKIMAHVESQEKLAAYLATVKKNAVARRNNQQIQTLLQKPTTQLQGKTVPQPIVVSQPTVLKNATPVDMPQTPVTTAPSVPSSLPADKQPFMIGVVKNNRKIPLSGLLIYVKDNSNKAVRLLKSNPHGIFATYNPLIPGNYVVEVKDPKGSYFFDTMKMTVGNSKPAPIELYSKELL